MSRHAITVLGLAIVVAPSTVFAQPTPPPMQDPMAPQPQPQPPPPQPDPQPQPIQPQPQPQPQPIMTAAPVSTETPRSGTVVEIKLEAVATPIEDDFVLPGTQGGFFIGFLTGAVTVGAGLELGRLTQSAEIGGTSSEASSTTLLFQPGVRFVLGRGSDGKLELLGQIDLGFGRTWQTSDNSEEDPEPLQRVRLQLAPALRYWVSQSFAVGATGGLRYERLSREVDDGIGNTATTTSAFSSIFASLQLTGVF